MGHAVHIDCIILLQCMVLFFCVHAWIGFACRTGECQAVYTEAEAPEEIRTDTVVVPGKVHLPVGVDSVSS